MWLRDRCVFKLHGRVFLDSVFSLSTFSFFDFCVVFTSRVEPLISLALCYVGLCNFLFLTQGDVVGC